MQELVVRVALRASGFSREGEDTGKACPEETPGEACV